MLRPLVADASALAEYILGTDGATSIGEMVEDPGVDVHAPALCDVEMVAALRRGMLHGSIRPRRASQALADYLDLAITRHDHGSLLGRALALRANFSAYDAMYVALAEQLGAALVTADVHLARATRRHTEIEVLTPTG